MKLSSLTLAAGLALGSAAANALTSPLDLSSGSAPFGATPVAGGFSDTFTFTLATAGTLLATVSSAVNGGQDVDFSFITLTGPSGMFSFTPVLPDPFEFWTLTTGLLAPGAYSLTLIGTNSVAVGSYAGTVAVSFVPEPETAALLLAGLLTVGSIARRMAK